MLMRTLKYVILGLLNQQPMSGYDIVQAFQQSLNEFWTAKHSQIYPELKRLTEEMLIAYQVEITGEVLEKKVYSITAAGKAEFLQWLMREEPMQQTSKDIFRLRMYFCNEMAPDIRLTLLQSQLQQHQLRLQHLQQNQQQFPVMPAADAPEFGDYLVLGGAVMREKMTIQWLEWCIRLCEAPVIAAE
jgi:DNA-binding PadR family transcriptional regulator